MNTLTKAIGQAIAESQAAKDAKDAERYRKIRLQAFGGEAAQWQLDEFDRAIDEGEG